MSTSIERDPVRGTTALPPFRTIHTYPTGGREPEIGDVALCGWVKRTPLQMADVPRSCARCVVCDDLSGRSR